MSRPRQNVSQSDSLIQLIDMNSHTEWQKVQIRISWLLQKPTDLVLHCLQSQGISGFSRTRVNCGILLYNWRAWDVIYNTCTRPANVKYMITKLWNQLTRHFLYSSRHAILATKVMLFQIRKLYEAWNECDTFDTRYLEIQETLWNTSSFPYLDIADLQNWGKNKSISHI